MSNEEAPRLKPVYPPDWKGQVEEAVKAFPNGANFIRSRWPGEIAGGANGFGTMLNHPALAKAFLTFNYHVANSTISARVREILILRIGWLRQAEYEFLQHVIIGRRAGLSDADIERITHGPDAPGWNDPIDAELVRAVDQLHTQACIQKSTWDRLAAVFNPQQMMDMIFAVGCYDVLAMVFKSYCIEIEAGVERMDPAMRTRMFAQGS